MIRTSTATALACLLTVLTVALAACGGDPHRPPADCRGIGHEAGRGLQRRRSGAGRADLGHRPADCRPQAPQSTSLAARVEYTSTSGITDAHTPVSGSVFVPKGKPPPGGWPILAFGHGTTGVGPDCGPSLSQTLLGSSLIVQALVNEGYLGDDARLPGPGYARELSPLPRLHHGRLQHDRRGPRRQETGAGGVQQMGGRRPLAGRAGGVGGQRTGRELWHRPGSAGIGQPFTADRPDRLRHRRRRGHVEQGSASGAAADPAFAEERVLGFQSRRLPAGHRRIEVGCALRVRRSAGVRTQGRDSSDHR